MKKLNRLYCDWRLRRFARRFPDQVRLLSKVRALLEQKDVTPENLRAQIHDLFEEARACVARSNELKQKSLKETFEQRIKERQDRIGQAHQQHREWFKAHYADKKERVVSWLWEKLPLLPPPLPEGTLKLISHDIVERKARAKLALERLHHLLAAYPTSSLWVRVIAFLLLGLGAIANFYFVSMILGPDWLAGQETASTLASGLLALLLEGAAVVGTSAIFAYFNEDLGAKWVRILQVAGGVLILGGVVLIYWIRKPEFGGTITPTLLGLIE